MKWFPGNVNTAIQVSRMNGALLIVFIETDDEKGKEMGKLWDSLDSKNIGCATVGIKMKKGEQAAIQFSEIYPTPILPATYLIDQTGKPIDIITHLTGLNLENFQAKVNSVVEQFVKSSPQSARVPAQIPTPSSSEDPQVSAEQEDRLNKAKELLEKKKRIEEERKLKEEQERKKSEVKIEEPPVPVKKPQKPAKQPEKVEEPVVKPIKDYTHCRIKVRLPDGSSYNDKYPVADSLNSLLKIVQEKFKISGQVELVNAYPRKTFTSEELARSFAENDLVPDASLFLFEKPKPTYLPTAKISSLTSFLSFILLTPINFVFRLVFSFFNGGGSKKDDPPAKQPTQARQRRLPEEAQIRRRGNIAGLHNTNGDDPEEQASFNGNSTQFM